MGASLEQWQARLHEHFSALAGHRRNSGFPIFALEHGLTADDRDELLGQLRERVRIHDQLSSHWLCWVVYATEHGYGYRGDEYWPSFKIATPGWQSWHQDQMVTWFRKFQRDYYGVEPSGPWASWFNRISWPITHAVLPVYLQEHFASTLYELRFTLANIASLEPEALGRVLAANAHGSRRFDQFLEQEALAGRIVLAVLRQSQPGVEEPIAPETLERLVADLENVRMGRSWLKDTRQTVRDRFWGIGAGYGSFGGQPSADAARIKMRPSMRPKLVLRHTGGGSWTPIVDVPDFNVVATTPELVSFLRSTPCRISGTDAPKPGAWVLGANRRTVLKEWPSDTRPMLTFTRTNDVIENLIQTDCRMSKGPHWLFRIGRDGVAYEVVGKIVRPGQDYVLVGASTPPISAGWTEPFDLKCTNAQAVRLRIPGQLSNEDIGLLEDVGLQTARTIRVWPAGLPGRGWDGEGNSEWLTTERPCIGIVHDSPVEQYVLSLNGHDDTVIDAGVVGHPTFVRLPSLPAGCHELRAKAFRSDSGQSPTSPDAEGHLVLNVRDPRPWARGRSFHSGLIVTADPADADLDAFWENEVWLSVVGPESHRLHCSVTFSKADGEEISSSQVGEGFNLPLSADTWRSKFEKFRNDSKRVGDLLEASSATLTISADELGQYRLLFERTAKPVRWILRQPADDITIHLIDDTGDEHRAPLCTCRNMERPLVVHQIDAEAAHTPTPVSAPGALYMAELGDFRDAVVVSVGLTGEGLRGLGVEPSFEELFDGSVTAATACRELEIWKRARLTGFLANVRRGQIVERLTISIYGAIGGARWHQAEVRYLQSPRGKPDVEELARHVDRVPGFAAVLKRDFAKLNEGYASGSSWFGERASRFDICKNSVLADFALRVASAPERLPTLCGDRLDSLIGELQSVPTLLRGARFLALLCATAQGGNQHLLPRWG